LSDIHGTEFLADLDAKNKAQSGGRLSFAKSLAGLKKFEGKARPLHRAFWPAATTSLSADFAVAIASENQPASAQAAKRVN
jgi:hypothetical protein